MYTVLQLSLIFPLSPALFLYFVLSYYYYFLVYRKLQLITPQLIS